MVCLGLLLTVLMGLSPGLLGGGGSILVYVLGFGAKEAIAASLAVVGLTSRFVTAQHWRGERVRLRVALSFGPVAAVGAYLGARLAGFSSGALQLTFFATVVLVAALFMLRNGDTDERAGKDQCGGSSGQLLLRFAVPGTGGVGGGFLIFDGPHA